LEDGLYEKYFENGQLELKANYKNGREIGDYVSYNEDGKLKFKRTMVESN
jgi:antitoxin component YwqK of YwqJK toxin-antitoxin module